jgi:hypothetical protein
MAADDDAAPAGGHGGGHHPGHRLLSGPHRDEILIVSSLVLVILGYLTLRKSSSPTTAPGLVSATNPSGAVAGYDASVMQGFAQLLQNQSDQLAGLNAALTGSSGGSGGASASTPSLISRSIFAPTNSGQYVRYGNGLIAEIESDGSQLVLNQSEWQGIRRQLGNHLSLDQVSAKPSGNAFGSVAGNLRAVNKPAPAAPTPVTTQ